MRTVQAECEPPRFRLHHPLSLRQAARSWLERNSGDFASSTVVAYRRSVDKICDGLGDTLVGDLTVAAVDDFERDLLDHGSTVGEPLSAKSVRDVHAVLHQILDDAVRRGIAPANVVVSAAPPRHEAPVVTVWIPDEVRTFLATARRHRLFPAFALLLATGSLVASWSGCVRVKSISMPARSPCAVRRVVTMTNGARTESEPKAAELRSVTIAARTTEMLRTHRADSGHPVDDVPVFEKQGGGELNPESLSITFACLVEHAEVSALTVGGLRHTHAAMAFKAGVNPLVVSKRLGHSTSATTYDIYGH